MGCATMREFCERLKVHGAVRYHDVRQRTGANELGLSVRPERVEDTSYAGRERRCVGPNWHSAISFMHAGCARTLSRERRLDTASTNAVIELWHANDS